MLLSPLAIAEWIEMAQKRALTNWSESPLAIAEWIEICSAIL